MSDETSKSWISNAINEQHIQLFDYKDFQNVKECAEGGLARVECADWTCSERKVALKKLKDFEIQRFVQEVKMHISCHWSRNVVRFFGLINEQMEYTMVMEYAEFESLRRFLKSGSSDIKWDIKYKFSLDIAKGLKCLHSHKIAHRDLHTDNIVIKRIYTDTSCCQPLIAQITDFGGATSMNKGPIDVNGGFGQVPFTEPNYFEKRCERDENSDIYSLGVIFWEISSGKIPFENYMPESHGKLRNMYLSLEIMSGKREEVPPSTPYNYSLLYKRCWNQERDKRPKIDEIIGILKRELEDIKQTTNKLTDSNNEVHNINKLIYFHKLNNCAQTIDKGNLKDGPNAMEWDSNDSNKIDDLGIGSLDVNKLLFK